MAMALTVTQSKTKVLFFSGIFEFPIRISRLISLPFDTWMQRVNGEPVPAPPNATACKNRRHSTDHCRRPRTLISRFPSLSLSESVKFHFYRYSLDCGATVKSSSILLIKQCDSEFNLFRLPGIGVFFHSISSIISY